MSTTRILGGLGWTTLGTAAQAVVQVAVIAALARLLPPAAFGLVAMTAVATPLAGLLAQLGMVRALVQETDGRIVISITLFPGRPEPIAVRASDSRNRGGR